MIEFAHEFYKADTMFPSRGYVRGGQGRTKNLRKFADLVDDLLVFDNSSTPRVVIERIERRARLVVHDEYALPDVSHQLLQLS